MTERERLEDPRDTGYLVAGNHSTTKEFVEVDFATRESRTVPVETDVVVVNGRVSTVLLPKGQNNR